MKALVVCAETVEGGDAFEERQGTNSRVLRDGGGEVWAEAGGRQRAPLRAQTRGSPDGHRPGTHRPGQAGIQAVL